jgi:hypothetical protein
MAARDARAFWKRMVRGLRREDSGTLEAGIRAEIARPRVVPATLWRAR